jgi:hypothetical protein
MTNYEKLIEHMEILADSVCKIVGVLTFRFDNFSYDEFNMLNNIAVDANCIKEELEGLKGGVQE